MTTTDNKSQVCLGAHPEQLRTPHVDFGKVLRNAYGALVRLPMKLPISLLEQHKTANNSARVICKLQKIKAHVPEKPTSRILVCPPEHFRRLSRKFLKFWLRIQYGVRTSYP